MEVAFAIILFVGLGMLSITLVMGELFDLGSSIGHEIGDLGHDLSTGLGEHNVVDLSGGNIHTPSPLSSSMIFAFFTCFGAFGLIGSVFEWPVIWTLTTAIFGGLAISIAVFFLVIAPISRQQGWTKESRNDLLNVEGQVISEIPENGFGQVTLISPKSGARVGQSAKSVNGTAIPTGTLVKVVHVGAGTLIVEPK